MDKNAIIELSSTDPKNAHIKETINTHTYLVDQIRRHQDKRNTDLRFIFGILGGIFLTYLVSKRQLINSLLLSGCFLVWLIVSVLKYNIQVDPIVKQKDAIGERLENFGLPVPKFSKKLFPLNLIEKLITFF